MTEQDERASGGGEAGDSEAELSAELEQLLGLARKSLTGRPPRRSAANPQQIERILAGRSRRRRAVGAALLAGAALLGGVLWFLWLRPGREVALRFEVNHGTLSGAGVVEATAEGTRVSFSDGTELALAAHGRARVEAVSSHGAELGLEQGRAKLDVVRRPGARWSVHAGPYLVRVTGTSFELEFEPEQRWLKLDLLVGSVSVSGPLIDGALQVSAGQRLLVRPGDALVLVQRRESQLAAPAPVAPALAPVFVEPGPPPAPPEPPGDVSRPRAANSERPAPRRASAPPRSVPAAPAAGESWQHKVAAGKSAEVIALAETRELAELLRDAPAEDLEALADAARYARRSELARPALLALRERFAGSRGARDAAFLLGRLDESGGATSAALAWYQRYLSDDPNGPYASQALGRQLSLSHELGPEPARALAREYLQRFPRGPYAARARELSGGQ